MVCSQGIATLVAGDGPRVVVQRISAPQTGQLSKSLAVTIEVITKTLNINY